MACTETGQNPAPLQCRILSRLGILALATGGCVLLGGEESARIRGYDALARPGESVVLMAKLETSGPSGAAPDIRGTTLRFGLAGRPVREATTDGDGKARVRVSAPPTAGIHRVQVDLAPGTPWSAAPETLLLRVLPADPALLVVDLDGTVTDASAAIVVLGSPEPYPAAPRILTEIARERPVVYLTARDDALLEPTRRFLVRHGFPIGPVLLADLHLDRLSAERLRLPIRSFWRSWTRDPGSRETWSTSIPANCRRPSRTGSSVMCWI